MKRTILIALTVICVPQPSGWANDAAPSADAELLQTDRNWSDVAATGTAEQILQSWTDDAVIFFPGRGKVVGKEAIREMILHNRRQPGFAIRWFPSSAKVAESQDLGHTLGTFRVSLPGPNGDPVVRHGHYVCIWERQDDSTWKCIVEISNFLDHDLETND